MDADTILDRMDAGHLTPEEWFELEKEAEKFFASDAPAAEKRKLAQETEALVTICYNLRSKQEKDRKK